LWNLGRLHGARDDRLGKSGHRRHVARGRVKLDVTASSSEFEQANQRPLLTVEFTLGQ
jgi:hypothetical protein